MLRTMLPSERGGFTVQELRFVVLKATSSLLHLGVVWYNIDVARLRNKGGKTALAGYKYLLRLSWYCWWALILSLWSGDGVSERYTELVC